MEQVSEELAGHPGAILRAAREEMGLSHDQAAEALHLRPAIVAALENDAFDVFDSPLFLRGYFRSYCRLVNLHEERMVELLDQLLGKQGVKSDAIDGAQESQDEAAPSNNAKVIGISLAALVALVIFFGFGGDDESIIAHEAPVTDLTKPAIVGSSDASASTSPADELLEANTDQRDAVTSTPVSDPLSSGSAEFSSSELPENEQQASEPSKPVSSEADLASSESVVATEKVILEAPEATETPKPQTDTVNEVGVSAGLKLAFSGDCWVTIANEAGRKLVSRLKKKGDVVQLSEQSTYNIVLGDASVVDVWFNGESVDLSSFTARNNRAEFSLPASI